MRHEDVTDVVVGVDLPSQKLLRSEGGPEAQVVPAVVHGLVDVAGKAGVSGALGIIRGQESGRLGVEGTRGQPVAAFHTDLNKKISLVVQHRPLNCFLPRICACCPGLPRT